MKSKNALFSLSMAVVLHFGVQAGSAQTNLYLFSGTETNITLPPGTYIITAYGAPGGRGLVFGGDGDVEIAEFNFSMSTTFTLLVGGGGGSGGERNCGGGGGGSFVVEGSTPLVIAGGGGGCGYIDGYNGDGGNDGTNGCAGGGYGFSSGSGGGGTGGGGGGGGTGTRGGLSGGGGGGGFLGDGTDGTGGVGIHTSGGAGGGSFESGGGAPYGHGLLNPPYAGGFGGGGGGGKGETDGGGGGGGGYSGGGGAGDETADEPAGGGGGGGSIIDSSAIAILVPTTYTSPDDPYNGEIIITLVPPAPLAITTGAAFGFTNGVFVFNVIGPSGSNVVIQASTDLQTWIPLQTNLLGSGPLHFSDPQSTTNVQRFYRVQLSP